MTEHFIAIRVPSATVPEKGQWRYIGHDDYPSTEVEYCCHECGGRVVSPVWKPETDPSIRWDACCHSTTCCFRQRVYLKDAIRIAYIQNTKQVWSYDGPSKGIVNWHLD